MRPSLICFLLWLLSWTATLGQQIKGTVTDKATGRAVAYANIWVENENIGVTSTESGSFSFADAASIGKTLVVSCLGYEQGRFPITQGPMAVQLTPAPVQLQEVTVRPGARRQKTVMGKLDPSSPARWFANGGTPWIVADFVPYTAQHEATPFLDQITFILWSRVDQAKFQIRVLEVGEDGKPGKDLLPEPLIGAAPKGLNVKMSLEVGHQDLRIPQAGFFLAFEWLIIPQNAYEQTYVRKGTKEKRRQILYEPSILSHSQDRERQRGWIYRQGAWQDAAFKVQDGKVIPSRAPQFQLTFSD